MKNFKSYLRKIERLINNNKVDNYYPDKLNKILYFDLNNLVKYFSPDEVSEKIQKLDSEISTIPTFPEFTRTIFSHTSLELILSNIFSVTIFYTIKLGESYEVGSITLLYGNTNADLGRIIYYDELPNIQFSVVPNEQLVLQITNNNDTDINIKYKIINSLTRFDI